MLRPRWKNVFAVSLKFVNLLSKNMTKTNCCKQQPILLPLSRVIRKTFSMRQLTSVLCFATANTSSSDRDVFSSEELEHLSVEVFKSAAGAEFMDSPAERQTQRE